MGEETDPQTIFLSSWETNILMIFSDVQWKEEVFPWGLSFKFKRNLTSKILYPPQIFRWNLHLHLQKMNNEYGRGATMVEYLRYTLFSFYKNNFTRTSRLKFGLKSFQKL